MAELLKYPRLLFCANCEKISKFKVDNGRLACNRCDSVYSEAGVYKWVSESKLVRTLLIDE